MFEAVRVFFHVISLDARQGRGNAVCRILCHQCEKWPISRGPLLNGYRLAFLRGPDRVFGGHDGINRHDLPVTQFRLHVQPPVPFARGLGYGGNGLLEQFLGNIPGPQAGVGIREQGVGWGGYIQSRGRGVGGKARPVSARVRKGVWHIPAAAQQQQGRTGQVKA